MRSSRPSRRGEGVLLCLGGVLDLRLGGEPDRERPRLFSTGERERERRTGLREGLREGRRFGLRDLERAAPSAGDLERSDMASWGRLVCQRVEERVCV